MAIVDISANQYYTGSMTATNRDFEELIDIWEKMEPGTSGRVGPTRSR